MMNCKVCSRDDRAVIEGTLRDNVSSLRAVASMFGLSKDAVHRHKARHMGMSPRAGHAVSTAASADADAERDHRALVACFPPGVPQRVGQWPLSETVSVWPHEKRVRILTEAIRRGDLVLDRRGSAEPADWHIERSQSRHVSLETARK